MTPAKRAAAQPASIHQLKVTLQVIRPPIWRRLQVPSEITLGQLHHILQIAMGWEDDHLHQFLVGRTVYGDPGILEDLADHSEITTRLSLVMPGPRSKFTYEYDFGDGWEHLITVEKVMAPESGVQYPICLAGERACPPEDCGGPWGYDALLTAIGDPSHPDHADLVEWMGSPIDPESFDLEGINRRLARVR